MAVPLDVIGIINFVQLLLVRKVAYTWWSLQTTLVQASAITTRKASHYYEQYNGEQMAWTSPNR